MSQFRPPPQSGWGQQPEPQQPGQSWQEQQYYAQWPQQSFPSPQQQNTGYYPQTQEAFPQQQPPKERIVFPSQPLYAQLPTQQQPQYQQPGFYQSLTPQAPPQTPIPQQWPQWEQQPPQMPMLPKQPQKLKKPINRKVGIGLGAATVLLIIIVAISIAAGSQNNSSPISTTNTPQATTSDQSTPVDQSTPTVQPTTPPTIVPTKSLAEQESDFKAGCQNYTVVNLDKGGSTLTGTDVHFKAQITNFVKDTSGNVAGANVTDPSDTSFVFIQVEFTTGTDVTQINASDSIEVWGTDLGSFSGTNAYGGTVQEVAIQIFYMVDLTTGYNPGS